MENTLTLIERLPIPRDCEKLVLFRLSFTDLCKWYYANTYYRKLISETNFWKDKCEYQIVRHQRIPRNLEYFCKHLLSNPRFRVKQLIRGYAKILAIYDVIDPELNVVKYDFYYRDTLAFYYRYPITQDPYILSKCSVSGVYVTTEDSKDNITYINTLAQNLSMPEFINLQTQCGFLDMTACTEFVKHNTNFDEMLKSLKTDCEKIFRCGYIFSYGSLLKILVYKFNPTFFNQLPGDNFSKIITGKEEIVYDGCKLVRDDFYLTEFILALDDPYRYEQYLKLLDKDVVLTSRINPHTFRTSKIWNFVVNQTINTGVIGIMRFPSYQMFWDLLEKFPKPPKIVGRCDEMQILIWKLVFPNTSPQ